MVIEKDCVDARNLSLKSSDKKKLGADARIIAALKRKQPQKPEALSKNAGIDGSTFYRTRRLLENAKLIKETTDGYALWYYSEGSLWDMVRHIFLQRLA